jgi:hypothetical protein
MDHTQKKILRGTQELETVTPQTISERASEIARSEGRPEANDLDRTRAREELTGSTSNSEESRTVGETDSDWYTPLGSSREKGPTVRPEDEEKLPKKLFPKGVEEADSDQRSRSGETDDT